MEDSPFVQRGLILTISSKYFSASSASLNFTRVAMSTRDNVKKVYYRTEKL